MITSYYIQSIDLGKNNTNTSTNTDNNKNTTNNNNITNTSNADFNYYLPADFAAIKISRGPFETIMTGVLINFEETNGNIYEYNSTDYPNSYETKNYLIYKDDLYPKVSEDWNFKKVKFVSFRYLLENNKASGIIMRTQINPNKTGEEFGEGCNFITEEGKQVSCS